MNINVYTNELNEDRVPMLVKENTVTYQSDGMMNQPQKVNELMRNAFNLHNKAEEHMYLLTLRAGKLIGVFQVGQGMINQCPFGPKEILTRTLLSGCSEIIVIHNHPSGNTTPSNADISATQRLKECCELMGIKLTDHIIIGSDGYLSFMEHQIL